MTHGFDELTKTLAGATSRRAGVRLLGAGLLGALTGSLQAQSARADDNGNAACAHFCEEVFPPGAARGQCTSEAAQGRGPCFECGPKAPQPPTRVLCGQVCCPAGYGCCGGACTPLTTTANCGACGRICTAPANASATCTNGTCGFVCNPGFHLCGGACVSNADVNSCGAACTPCPAPANASATCTNGTCGFVCNPGFVSCGGRCVAASSFQSDPNNCGACGRVCPASAPACAGGVCLNPNTRCDIFGCSSGICCRAGTDPCNSGVTCENTQYLNHCVGCL